MQRKFAYKVARCYIIHTPFLNIRFFHNALNKVLGMHCVDSIEHSAEMYNHF